MPARPTTEKEELEFLEQEKEKEEYTIEGEEGIHAFTLNPNPKKYKSTDPCEQYATLLQCLFKYKYLNACFEEYYFVPELTENGNVHIHGYYKIKDKVKYYRWFLPACKAWGFIKVKSKNIDDEWIEYVNKTIEEMKEIMENYPVPMTRKTLEVYKKEIKVSRTMQKQLPKKGKFKSIDKYFK